MITPYTKKKDGSLSAAAIPEADAGRIYKRVKWEMNIARDVSEACDRWLLKHQGRYDFLTGRIIFNGNGDV